jgi:mannose-6-phosphate isomerase-like protein (cupin superfamily)
MIIRDIEHLAERNTNFREVVHTGKYSQIALMSLPVGTDIGPEIHESVDQLVFVVEGHGEAVLDSDIERIEDEDVVFIPAGIEHDIRNTGDEDLKLYTIYSAPVHAADTIHKTRNDALKENV